MFCLRQSSACGVWTASGGRGDGETGGWREVATDEETGGWGDGMNETDVATEALVFMVVGLQGHWKAPIGYYLTKSPSPETQKALLVHEFEELHERGIRVMCVTMDGHASNVSMCNRLAS